MLILNGKRFYNCGGHFDSLHNLNAFFFSLAAVSICVCECGYIEYVCVCANVYERDRGYSTVQGAHFPITHVHLIRSHPARVGVKTEKKKFDIHHINSHTNENVLFRVG